ncbi:MAG TPA: hypothetical protein DDZ51_00265 [Planctomycetaceae bacterium]|nr:hypothetical protein [Planctomycetaceae bacterium]
MNQTALQFNGIDNYVDITSDWTWEGQDFTFEAWLTVPKLADDAPQITLLSLEHGKTERTGLRLSRQLHRSLGSRVLNSSIYQSEFHPLIRDEIPTNQLTHLAVSWSNSSASFFVDGHKQPAGESRHIYILNKDGDLKHTYLAAFGGNKNSDNPQFFWRGLIHQARFTSGVLYDTDFTPEQEF